MNCFVLVFSSLMAAASPETQVAAVLDGWHQAASVADEARYFSAFTPDGVFLGTDAKERWTRDEFRTWAKPIFAKGKAWSFKSVRRSIHLSKDGNTAWFDEDLTTEKLGPCRGSGVLVKDGTAWKIAQYNLTTPIPNEVFDAVKTLIAQPPKKAP